MAELLVVQPMHGMIKVHEEQNTGSQIRAQAPEEDSSPYCRVVVTAFNFILNVMQVLPCAQTIDPSCVYSAPSFVLLVTRAITGVYILQDLWYT